MNRTFLGRRDKFTESDVRAALEYLAKDDSTNSVFGLDGIIGEYERALASYHGRQFALLCNSGTSALFSAYFSIGIGPGVDIVAPTFTFPATVTPALQLGAKVRLVDCESNSPSIDACAVEEALSPNTKAIVFTHMWGNIADVLALREVAQRHGVYLIEDNSLAIGGSRDGVLTGSLCDAVCFSLGSTKMFSGGQGGALLTDNLDILERATLLGHFGRRAFEACQTPKSLQFADTGFGMNLRMHVLSAAISFRRFQSREGLIQARKKRYALLCEALASSELINPPVEQYGNDSGSWQGFVATLSEEGLRIGVESIAGYLTSKDIEVQAFAYYPPLHLRRLFQTRTNGLSERYGVHPIVYRRGAFPNSEALYDRMLSFPLFLDEPIHEVESYCSRLERGLHELRELAVIEQPKPTAA